MALKTSVYRKTPAGLQEMQTRAAGLHPQTRRVLILTDGISSLSRIAAYVRGAEILPLIEELLNAKLIEAVPEIAPEASADALNVKHEEMFPGPTLEQMIAIREVLLYALRAMVGHGATDLEDRIASCENSAEMRKIVGEMRSIIDRHVSAAAGDRFIEAVRAVSQAAR
jgi:hypothetical protein